MDKKNVADRRVMALYKMLAYLLAIKGAVEETIDLTLLELEEASNVRAETSEPIGCPPAPWGPPPQGLPTIHHNPYL